VVGYGEQAFPVFVKDDYLYILGDLESSDSEYHTYIYKYNLNTESITEIVQLGSGVWMGHHVVDYVGRRVVIFGPSVVVLDPYTDSVDIVRYYGITYDAFGGAVYDHKNRRFIAGGWYYGELWVIPYEGILDNSTWSKVYRFPYYVSSVAVFNDYVYVGLSSSGIMKAGVDDLTSWVDVRDDIDPNTLPYVDAENGLLAIGYVTGDGKIRVEWTSDGVTWDYVDVADKPNIPDVEIWVDVIVKVVGRFIVVASCKLIYWGTGLDTKTDVFLVDTYDRSVITLATDLVNCVMFKSFVYDGSGKLYFGTYGSGNTEVASIYSVEFDGRRVLSLSVNGLVVPGQVVELVATLTDGVEPLSSEEVEFYLVDSINIYSPTGALIGTAITDDNGRASVSYTVPSTASGVIMFAAINKGARGGLT
jgi:hypothetical protein